eukprot:GFYU01007877.1.p1 GENE.GFYU01007877.1~~GFYU01007877.1.p1  ORF type:complete len:128 (-),score=21.10 GFYU01007877.1:187-570(-)
MSAAAAQTVARRTPAAKKAIITVTEAAASRIKQLLSSQKPPPMGVKIGVRKGGCNGMSYTMNYAKDVGKFDEVVNEKGVTVVVDPKATMYLIGTEMDFVDTRLKSEFQFNNPNATSQCGCAKSFNVR